MISSPRAGAGVVISGIDPAREKEVTDMASRVREGSYFQSGKRNPVLVSHSLCEKLGVRLGSKIVLTFQDAQNAITAGAFRIAGIFRSENSLFDESNVFVLRETLARLTGLPARVHEIAVRLDRPADIENTAAKLHAGYPGLKIRTWKQIEPELEYLHEINKLMMFIFMGIILFALAFGIVNTMLMVVLERTRELGMLVALGMTRRKVFAMIVLETVFLSAAGALFGFLIGIAAVNGLGETGIDLGYFAEGLSSYGISHIVHPRLRAGDYPGLACLVAGTALLSSIYPAARALRINPARAVRMT
jgi:ABC-type lipoprotein release transport system permease subunit